MNHHRVAIALNNIGVDLIERQYYEQARDTLVDAVTVMRACCCLCNVESVAVQEMLHQANCRRARSHSIETSMDGTCLADTHKSMPTSSTFDEDDDCMEDDFGRPSGFLSPIRLDDVNHDIRCPSILEVWEVQIAILLYNLALSHHGVAHGGSVVVAYKLFLLSHSILSRIQVTDGLVLLQRQVTYLHVAILTGLVQTESAYIPTLQWQQARLKEMDQRLDRVLGCVQLAAGAA